MIGKKIKYLRTSGDMSRARLWMEMGNSSTTGGKKYLQQVEERGLIPTPHRMIDILGVFGISQEYFDALEVPAK